MQINTTRQVINSLNDYSHLYLLHVKVIHLIPLLYYLKRVLGFIKEMSIKASCIKEEDVH
jgi:hypothetical protein